MLSGMLNNKINILKKDGSLIEGIDASVQKSKIFIDKSDILIETGDLVEHKMSNGGVDTYKVIDPNFKEPFGGIDAHYQMEVMKLGLEDARSAKQTVYNLSGNARINQNSVDNSTNSITNNSKVISLIGDLRKSIDGAGLPDSEKKDALEIVDAIELQANSGKMSKTE